jgi:hypothetical protein
MPTQPDNGQGSDFPVGVSNPARRALASAGYSRLEKLTTVSEAEIAKLHGIGPNALAKLRDALAARGLSFRQTSAREGTRGEV